MSIEGISLDPSDSSAEEESKIEESVSLTDELNNLEAKINLLDKEFELLDIEKDEKGINSNRGVREKLLNKVRKIKKDNNLIN